MTESGPATESGGVQPRDRRDPRPSRGRAARHPGERPESLAAVLERGSAAWPRFAAEYSDFILGCIRRLASDADEQMDIYVHVCTRLHADDCRRLRQFRGYGEAGACRFTTWLATVVLNLGREWIRSKRGRRRMFRAVRRMSLLDQLVFRYHYWESMPASQIVNSLRWNHGFETSAADIERRLGRLRETLAADGCWRVVSSHNRSVGLLPLDEDNGGRHTPTRGLASHHVPSDAAVSHKQAVAKLRSAVRALPAIERRALEERFARGKTAREAAESLGLDNFKQVYEIQARALIRLRREMRRAGVRLEEFGPALDATEILR